MVRLRREIEGIHLDRSVPPPPWAATQALSDAIQPSWPAAVRALDGERLLFCGLPNERLALEIAATGKWVTLSDLVTADVRRISASLNPDVASRIQLVAKPYGSATFTPSSFDTIILSDQLHAYDAPQWVLQKVKRELKVDGILLARLDVAGDIEPLPAHVEAPMGEPAATAWRPAVAKVTPVLARIMRSPAAPLWLGEDGLEALQRRALWSTEERDARWQQKRRLDVQIDAVASRLHLEHVQIGSTLRAATLSWGAGAHPGVQAVTARLALAVPELADQEDRRRGERRAVWIRARRALMSGGKVVTFG